MIEDEPKLFDGSDLNQSVLNKMSQDKFQLILGIPEVMRAKNTASKRDQSLINLDSLQFSLVDATIPAQSVKMKSLGFGGQKMPVTSYARDGQPEVTVNFTVDNNFANYKYLWEWLDNLNHCKESIPTKDYYKIAGNPEFAMKMNGGPDEPERLVVKDSYYKHSFFDYQTIITLKAAREYNEPIAEFTYTNAFITELGELKFDYKSTKQLSCTFKFAFGQQYFKILHVDTSIPKER